MASPTPTTPYRLYHFRTPTSPPFEPGPNQWPTIVAECIAPVFKGKADTLYWFCNHGQTFQVCFAADEYLLLDKALADRMSPQEMNIETLLKPTGATTVASAFAGSRWTGRNAGTASEAKTSELTLRVLHAACELYIDMLFQTGSHWFRDLNSDHNNPKGSAFESVFHLISNLSDTEVEVEILARTPFMAATGMKVAVKL